MDPSQHLLYFALRPPPGIADVAVRRLPRSVRAAQVPPERLHVSLFGLGRFARRPDAVIDAARAAASRVRSPRFRLAFNRLGTWGRGEGLRPVVLSGDEGVIGAEALHAALHARLAEPGLARGAPRPIWPHMTLARARCETPEMIIAPVTWEVAEFVLIDSRVGEGRHEALARFPLR